MTGEDRDPLEEWFQGLEWQAAQVDARAATWSRAAETRTARFVREAFAEMPVTAEPAHRRRCLFCRRWLAANKREDALYCSARCRDRAYRRRLHKAAKNLEELQWSLALRAGADTPSCRECGRHFDPEMYRIPRSDRRYCSGACRTRAWRARKASVEAVTAMPVVTARPDA
ncbi:hypothetical protein GCM10027038_10120 [Arthrobacter bambusae]